MEFNGGLNVITGETGAGKSILIGAMNLVLGERADRDLIRSGSDSCAVEALFDVARLASIPPLLRELGLEDCADSQLILKRVFTAAGANRQFVNGSPATLQALKQIGELLVDIHGPHDHQSLFRTSVQLRILDCFAGLNDLRNNFTEKFREVREIAEQKRALVMDPAEFERRLDLLAHQVNEITAARLSPDEETALEADYHKASNAQKLLELIGRAQQAISEGEHAAVSALAQAQRALRDLASIDPQAAPLEETNQTLVAQLQELGRDLSRYATRVELDPDRLQSLSERITLIQGLKRKYGKTLAEIIEFEKNARGQLEDLRGRKEKLAQLEKQTGAFAQALEKDGMKLRSARLKAIPKLAREITDHLRELGFLQSKFDTDLVPCEAGPSGMDAIEFRFAPNPGEPPKSLRDIASSGEMARVMLALKTALAEQDEVPILVFDEVDANIGGEIGNRVGEKMARIGRRHQVLCITHLPQVAAHTGHHHVAVKSVEKGRAFTRLERLAPEKRAEEIARMLGGKTETSLKHAQEMIQAAGKSRKAQPA